MYEFDATLWRWDGDAPWHFLTLPDDVSDDIEASTAGRRRGFGSVRVEVTVGATTWRTSLFPDTKRGAYLLPVKREVRRAEDLDVDGEVHVQVRVLD